MTCKLSLKNLSATAKRYYTNSSDLGPKNSHLSLRVSSDLYGLLEEMAEEKNSSISKIVRKAIVKEVKKDVPRP